jgi:hypothetical protein
MIKRCFDKSGNWYKGNLHTHTTLSDGKLSPEKTIQVYKDLGYDFLSLTDHVYFSKHKDLSSMGLTLIPGTELDIYELGDNHIVHHMVGLQADIEDDLINEGRININIENDLSIAEKGKAYAHLLKDKGMISIYCHPSWSRVEIGDIKPIMAMNTDKPFAIEVYNNGCEGDGRVGHAELYWDQLLRNNIRCFGVATDDSHNLSHCGGGYVMVNAKSKNNNDIIKSLLEGNFYSSMGPEIHDFYLEDRTAYVKCSPCSKIHFITYEWQGKTFFPTDGTTIDNASYKLKEGIKYIRIECEDKYGKIAWSNPIFMD